MRILFILDSVENPTSANVLMAQRLAGVLCAAGHTVHLLELWDGLHPQPELPGCTVHCLAFADERLMNAALENGRSGGSPIPVRLARLCCHPTAVAAAFRQLVLHAPRRVVDTRRELEKLDAAFHFEVICAVCAPYRAAFALETAQVQAKKAIWQLDPYASNRDYQAPGGYPRELELLNPSGRRLYHPAGRWGLRPRRPAGRGGGKSSCAGFPQSGAPGGSAEPCSRQQKALRVLRFFVSRPAGAGLCAGTFPRPGPGQRLDPDDGRRRLAILCRGRCPDQGCIGRTV